MPERIYKLQPDRTVQLRGFDHLGASAAVHSATAAGFKVTGNFRDAADFAVVVLYDADNFYEHPRLKYLPDFNFAGLTLQFDVAYENLMPLDSKKYATIDWPYLDVAPPVGASTRVRLSDHATVVGGSNQKAAGTFTIVGDLLEAWDRVTLWYQNLAFDYIVPGKVRTEYAFFAAGPGTIHSIVVRDRGYAYVEQEGDGSASVAAKLAGCVNGTFGGYTTDGEVEASIGSEAHTIRLTRKLDTGATVTVSASGNISEELYHVKATTVCRELAAQINGAGYGAAATPYALEAVADGTTLRISSVEGGYDANFIEMYRVSKNERLTTQQERVKFSGGESGAVLRVTLDFSALGLNQIRQMWLTLAPRLADGAEYAGEEWEATFSNWTVTGPEDVRALQVAAPQSVTVGALDERVNYTGPWVMENGFFLGNTAMVARTPGAAVTVDYHCGWTHDVWVWTSLYSDRGGVGVELDGAAAGSMGATLAVEPAVVTRRKVATGVAAGDHRVRLVSGNGQPFYFVGIEAVVAADVPDALPAQTFSMPAFDYSTDHTYKLSPERIHWMLDRLGCAGQLNEYMGIFWWNERRRVGGVMPEVEITFSGEFAAGDEVFLNVGGQVLGKSVLMAEGPESVARHFAAIVNSTLVGAWAKVVDTRLVLTARSAAAAYNYLVTSSMNAAEGSTGTVTGNGVLGGGSMGRWEVDPEAERVLNAGARAWHEGFYRGAAARGRAVTTSFSMELVNPPAGYAAVYPDGVEVLTDMGFGGLRSTHCAFSSQMLAFQKRAFVEVAELMAAAGLGVDVQFGEFTWWYFSNWSEANPAGGMAYYDAETEEAAATALGRPLHRFRGPNDDPLVNGGADATFLRNRLRDYAAALMAHVRGAHAGAQIEILYPHDVNHPEPAGVHQLGGRLNHWVNLPVEWRTKVAGSFDRFRVEALDYGVWSRNLDLSRICLEYPLAQGWPAGSVRAMIAVFRGGYPWLKEVQYARELGMECVSLWAFDHVCLYGLDPAGTGVGRAFQLG